MPVDSDRPTPEQFLNLIRRQERGRLKVYVGSSAGVGKTYAMLRDGARLRKQGVDVAIGLVETHGRVETAEQIGELEVIPPRTIEYRGVTLREMDLDAIRAGRPSAWLMNSRIRTPPAASTPSVIKTWRISSAPASMSSRPSISNTSKVSMTRWSCATGVKVKERLPDHVLADADQVVNIDVSTEDLLERLKAGKVYPPERAERAMANFFTTANLTRLRELTLSELAHLIDRRSRRDEADRAPSLAADRVMVGLASRGPNAPALLRRAARLADRLSAPWYAVYIQTPAEDLTRVDAATQRVLATNLELARQLGGIPMTFRGRDVAATIAAFAAEYSIKLVVLGKSRQTWSQRFVYGSLIDRVARATTNVDILVVDV